MIDVSIKGHFGEWLQGRLGPEGPVALVTVLCPVLRADAPGTGETLFAAEDLRGFAEALGLGELPGVVRNFPVGVGAGASSATLVAMARAAGFDGPPETLARACLAVEGATDPLMFERPDTLLWASREARVLRRLPPPPACEILGGFWGAPERTDPDDHNFADIADLAEDWAGAVAQRDLARAARIAATSARRCTERRGPPDPTADLCAALGALGWLRAHTGSARGLIFAPGAVPAHGADALREAGLSGILRFATGAP